MRPDRLRLGCLGGRNILKLKPISLFDPFHSGGTAARGSYWPALLGSYVLLVLYSTLSPWSSVADITAAGRALTAAWLPQLGWRDLVDAARNLLLFAAWGGLWMLRLERPWRRTDLGTAMLTGLLLSLLIETLQLFNALRYSSVLDLLTNTLGAGLGAGAALAARRWLRSRLGRPGRLVLLVTTAGLLTALAMDFLFPVTRLQIPAAIWGTPLERARAVFQQPDLSLWAWPWADLLLCIPAGWLLQRCCAVLRLWERPRRQSVITVSIASVIVLELLHPLLGYPPQIGAALIHLGGLGIGAALGTSGIGRVGDGDDPVIRWWGWAAYGALLGLWLLRPYELVWPEFGSGALQWDRLIPLTGHKWRSDIFSVVDLLKTICLFAPLGLMLALQPCSTTPFLRGVWPVFYLALSLEFAQIFLRGRYPDATDVVMAVVAAWLVLVLVARARSEVGSPPVQPG